MHRVVTIFVLYVFGIRAQQIGQNTQGGGNNPSTFSTSSQLVIETVNVKDKSGKAVEGLTAKDFTVTEDGTEQSHPFLRISEGTRGSRGRASDYHPASASQEASSRRRLPPSARAISDTKIVACWFFTST